MSLRRIVLLALTLVSAGVSSGAQTPAVRPLRILFIGNSLTQSNDLPGIVTRLAMADGQPQPLTRMVAVGGFSLEDHWNQGDAQRAIAAGPWDFVVLQQGPSALPDSRQLLVAYARRFGDAITKAGARPAMYMVWPSQSRRSDFGGVSESYRAAAKAIGAVVLGGGRSVELDSAAAARVVALQQRWPASDLCGELPGGARDLSGTLRAIADRPAGTRRVAGSGGARPPGRSVRRP